MTRSIEKILLWTIRICAGLVLAVPLLVTWGTMFPFIFGKMIAFRLLVEIAGAAWIILLAQNPLYRPSWKHPIIATATLFIGILALTMVTGVDPSRSFWSTQERMTGVLSFFHFWLLLLILTSSLKSLKEWRSLFFVSLGINVLIGMYGLFAHGIRAEPIVSTLGNAIYTSVYAMLHVFIAAWAFLFEKNRAIRIALCASILLNILIIGFAGSRSVLLSFVASLCAGFVFLVFSRSVFPKRARTFLIIGVCTAFVIAAGVLLWLMKTEQGQTWGKEYLPYTVTRTIYFGRESNQDRLALWTIGLRGFRERPILGWGWENYRTIYEKYLIPRAYMDQWNDRSHNQLIDVLALTGMVGMGAYMALWGALFFVLYRLYRIFEGKNTRIGVVILGVFFLSYFLQNLTIFDSPTPLILFFFTLSFVVFYSQRYEAPEQKIDARRHLVIPSAIIAPLVVIVFVFGAYVFTIAPFIQSSEGVKGIFLLRNNQQAGIEKLKKALSKRSFVNNELLIHTTNIIWPLFSSPESRFTPQEKLQFMLFLKEKHNEHIGDQQNINKIQHYIVLAGLNFHLYEMTLDESYLRDSERTLSVARELSPRRFEVFAQLAQLATLRNEEKKAVAYAEQAFSVVADRDRQTALLIYVRALFLAGEIDKGFEILKKAEGMGVQIYDDSIFAITLARRVFEKDHENVTRAREYVDRAVEKHPDDPAFQGAKILIYEKTGRGKEAQKLFEEIKRKNPAAADSILQLKALQE